MHANTRALVAAAAAKLVSGDGNVGAIYDYSRQVRIQVSGSVTGDHVQLYDHDRSCHFSGTRGHLYDHGRACHVSLAWISTARS